MSRRLFTRMAWRDAWRNKWRSLLMLVMVALPVAGVTAVDVMVQTTTVDVAERAALELGPADARVYPTDGPAAQMGADHQQWAGEEAPKGWVPPSQEKLAAVLGRPAEVVEVRSGAAVVDTDRGKVTAEVVGADWSDDLTSGISRLADGRYPREADEVAVNASLGDRGPGLGERLVSEGREFTVVGIVEDRLSRSYPYVYTVLDSALLTPDDAQAGGVPPVNWLVRTAGGVSWPDVVKLNAAGMVALSREVVENPPSAAELSEDFGYSSGGTEDVLAVIALVVAMALLEVVLLAGPGFAVSARRMQRSLALMAVSGATPRQARRAVMATAWVMGTLAAVVGLAVGVLVAWLVTVVGQRWYSEWFQAVDVTWWHLLVIGGFGLLSAVLASAAPAWLASRLDVVAVLGGRRGDPPARLRSPLLGLALIGVGVALAVVGAGQSAGGEMWVAFSAVVAVLGTVLVIPVVLSLLGRLAGRLPLAGRYTVRDAARHRSRTAPAVAAVVATVAGAVALGTGLSSDEREAEATYTPSLPMGVGIVTNWSSGKDLDRAGDVVRRALPGADVLPVVGVHESAGWVDVRPVGVDGPDEMSYGGIGSSVVVADEVPAFLELAREADRRRANQALAEDGVVYLFAAPGLREVKVVLDSTTDGTTRKVRAPAISAPVAGPGGALAVLAPSVAEKLGVEAQTVSWMLRGTPVTRAQQSDLEERLAGVGPDFSVVVERGYQRDPAITIVIWALVGVAALLMLGGTLTSTFLSLSDARADLSTLAAIGAAPRTRRRIAAGYALVIAGVGAVLGVLVGLVPGIAVSYPLTNQAVYGNHTDGPMHYLVVPWPVIGVVLVGLPLLTALVAALATRSKLPLLGAVD